MKLITLIAAVPLALGLLAIVANYAILREARRRAHSGDTRSISSVPLVGPILLTVAWLMARDQLWPSSHFLVIAAWCLDPPNWYITFALGALALERMPGRSKTKERDLDSSER